MEERLSFKQIFQLTYMFLHFFCLIGIAGNLELGIKTPTFTIVLTLITGFLTIEKFIYVYTLKEN